MKKIIALVMTTMMMVACFCSCAAKPTADNSSKNGPVQPDPKVVTIGYTLYEPMNYLDKDGKLTGFDTELAKAVFEGMGYTPVFKLIDWSNKYVDLNSGTIDCVWNGFTANTADDDGIARAEKVDFSYNYMLNKQVIVAKKDTTIKTMADLNGKKGAAEKGSAGESYAKNLKGVTVQGVSYQTDALMEVNSSTADFAVLDEQLAKSMCGKGNYTNLAIVEGLGSDAEYYAIGFKKNSELTAKVNAELEKLAANGTITALAKKYKLDGAAIIDFADQKADEK